jgi:hypothetical protein
VTSHPKNKHVLSQNSLRNFKPEVLTWTQSPLGQARNFLYNLRYSYFRDFDDYIPITKCSQSAIGKLRGAPGPAPDERKMSKFQTQDPICVKGVAICFICFNSYHIWVKGVAICLIRFNSYHIWVKGVAICLILFNSYHIICWSRRAALDKNNSRKGG